MEQQQNENSHADAQSSAKGATLTDGLCATDEAQKIEALKRDAHEKLRAAEKAWYAFFGALDVGAEREFAADVYERVRTATRKW